MFSIKIYIKESYINYYDTSIQMCGQYCILVPNYYCHTLKRKSNDVNEENYRRCVDAWEGWGGKDFPEVDCKAISLRT